MSSKKDIRNFLHRNCIPFAAACICILMCYAKHAFTTNVDIDTEELLLGGTSNINGWLVIGRFGSYYTKYLLDGFWYNPYFSGVIFLMLFAASVGLWLGVMDLLEYKAGILYKSVFAILYSVAPVWCFILYFSMIQTEVMFGVCCSVAAIYLICELVKNGSGMSRIKASGRCMAVIACIVWALASYQALAVYCLIGIAGSWLIRYMDMEQDTSAVKGFCEALFMGILFVAGYAAYSIISKSFFGGSSYLSEQINWMIYDKAFVISEIKRAIHMMLDDNYVYWKALKFCMLLSVIAVAAFWVTRKADIRAKILFTLGVAAYDVIPFALNIYLGGTTEYRTQFPVALYMALAFVIFVPMLAEAMSAVKIASAEKYVSFVMILAAVVISYRFASVNLRLWYTDDMCNEQDRTVAERILDDMLDAGITEETPVVVLGKKQVRLNPACLPLGTFGVSNFSWDYSSPTGCTVRTMMYMEAALGCNYGCGDAEMREFAVEEGRKMNSYPAAGYVSYDDRGFAIVKLSDY